MTKREICLAAAELLRTKGWCQGKMAADKKGNPVDIRSPYAEQFCLVGALERVITETNHYAVVADLSLRIALADPSVSITAWNDRAGRTKDEVIALLTTQGEGYDKA